MCLRDEHANIKNMGYAITAATDATASYRESRGPFQTRHAFSFYFLQSLDDDPSL